MSTNDVGGRKSPTDGGASSASTGSSGDDLPQWCERQRLNSDDRERLQTLNQVGPVTADRLAQEFASVAEIVRTALRAHDGPTWQCVDRDAALARFEAVDGFGHARAERLVETIVEEWTDAGEALRRERERGRLVTDGGQNTDRESDGGHRHALPDVEMLEPSEVEEKISSVDDPGSLQVLIDDERLCENRSEVIAAIEDRLASVQSNDQDGPEVEVRVAGETETLETNDTTWRVCGVSTGKTLARHDNREDAVAAYSRLSEHSDQTPILVKPGRIYGGHDDDDQDDNDPEVCTDGGVRRDTRAEQRRRVHRALGQLLDADRGPHRQTTVTAREVARHDGDLNPSTVGRWLSTLCGEDPFYDDESPSAVFDLELWSDTGARRRWMVSDRLPDGTVDEFVLELELNDTGTTAEVMTDGGVESPFPATGTVVPEPTGHRASFDCATEYFSEADEDYLYRAVSAAANEYGIGTEVRVRFTGSEWTCNGFELLGPVDEAPDDVQRLNDVRRMLDTSRWPSLTPEQVDRIEDAFGTVDSVAREVRTEDDIDRGEGVETDGGTKADSDHPDRECADCGVALEPVDTGENYLIYDPDSNTILAGPFDTRKEAREVTGDSGERVVVPSDLYRVLHESGEIVAWADSGPDARAAYSDADGSVEMLKPGETPNGYVVPWNEQCPECGRASTLTVDIGFEGPVSDVPVGELEGQRLADEHRTVSWLFHTPGFSPTECPRWWRWACDRVTELWDECCDRSSVSQPECHECGSKEWKRDDDGWFCSRCDARPDPRSRWEAIEESHEQILDDVRDGAGSDDDSEVDKELEYRLRKLNGIGRAGASDLVKEFDSERTLYVWAAEAKNNPTGRMESVDGWGTLRIRRVASKIYTTSLVGSPLPGKETATSNTTNGGER